jgi:hypothetical protein
MLKLSLKANMLGCPACFNFQRKFKTTPQMDLPEELLLTADEAAVLFRTGVLKTDFESEDCCSLVNKKVKDIKVCPIGK